MMLQNHRIVELLGEINEHIGCLKLECEEIADKVNSIRNEVGRVGEIFGIENALDDIDANFEDMHDHVERLKSRVAER